MRLRHQGSGPHVFVTERLARRPDKEGRLESGVGGIRTPEHGEVSILKESAPDNVPTTVLELENMFIAEIRHMSLTMTLRMSSEA